MASLKKVLQKKKYIRIPLSKTGTNHLELKAAINGIEGYFILDTGASNSCVGSMFIDFFELDAQKSDEKAAGAGTTDMETQKSHNNTLHIGDWFTYSFNIIIFDLKHVNNALKAHHAEPVHGIIGADILEKGKAFIDYRKKVLYLKKTKK